MLEDVARKLKGNPTKALFGRALTASGEKVSWTYPSVEASAIKEWLRSHDPNHQAIFFPKSFYKKYRYNLKYKITADLDYKLQAKRKVGFFFIDLVLVRFELGGVSTQNENFDIISQRITESIIRNMEYGLYKELLIDPLNIFSKYILAKIFGEKHYKVIKYIKRYH